MLFKGYIKLNGKQAVEKFKDRTDLRSLDEVQHYEGYAGILDTDTVLIDIDNEEQSQVMLNMVKDLGLITKVYKTTKGMHFYFKNSGLFTKCRTNVKTAVGLTIDIKVGLANSYSVLKYDGKVREVIFDNTENENVQVVPKWLLPVKSKYDLWELGEGSRNNTLFEYILVLQSADFSKEEIKECLNLANDFVLEYPLEQEELDVILRDESFSKQIFFKNNQFLFDKFAHFLKSEFSIKFINGQLYMFNGSYYIPCEHNLESEMIKKIPNLNDSKRKEVMKYVHLISDVCTDYNASDRYICFTNGVYDVFENEFIKGGNPNIIVTNQIPHAFSKKAYNSTVDTMLNKLACNNENIRALLEEMVGYCFFRRNELGKFFVLTGEKSNGKSTFLGMIVSLLGEDNISALDLKELNEKFVNTTLSGKLANIGDDIDDEYIRDTSVLKKLVTGERMTVQEKGGKPYQFRNYAKFMFSANSIPKLGKGKDVGALMRRMVIVPFNATFSSSDKDYNPYIKYELQEESAMEYLIQLGIKGLKRVLTNKKFTECEEVEQMINDYKLDCDPFLEFLEEKNITKQTLIDEFTSDVYRQYKLFCENGNYSPLSQRSFTQRIKKEFQLTTKSKYDTKSKNKTSRSAFCL